MCSSDCVSSEDDKSDKMVEEEKTKRIDQKGGCPVVSGTIKNVIYCIAIKESNQVAHRNDSSYNRKTWEERCTHS